MTASPVHDADALRSLAEAIAASAVRHTADIARAVAPAEWAAEMAARCAAEAASGTWPDRLGNVSLIFDGVDGRAVTASAAVELAVGMAATVSRALEARFLGAGWAAATGRPLRDALVAEAFWLCDRNRVGMEAAAASLADGGIVERDAPWALLSCLSAGDAAAAAALTWSLTGQRTDRVARQLLDGDPGARVATTLGLHGGLAKVFAAAAKLVGCRGEPEDSREREDFRAEFGDVVAEMSLAETDPLVDEAVVRLAAPRWQARQPEPAAWRASA